ncbi:MAG: DUF4249 family protein [Flavobacteriales bacterium]|nr:DUF4249 family protein [Flavobacteriales bacterium]
MKRLPLFIITAAVLISCEKEITVELPTTPSKVVVEGVIETGQVPIVLLSRTQSFFEPTTISGLASLYITSATVIVSDGIVTDTLDRVCSSQLTEDQLIAAAAATGIECRPSAPDRHLRLDRPRWYDGRYGRTLLFAHRDHGRQDADQYDQGSFWYSVGFGVVQVGRSTPR